MRGRGARLAVAVLFAVAAAVGAWQYLRADRALESDRAALGTFEHDARSLATSIVDLRSAQQSYVAIGQGLDYWTARVSTLTGAVRDRLADLRSRSSSAQAGERLDAAAATLDDFSRMDGRVREYARSGDQLLASDLIFAEGFEMTEGLAADLDGALRAEVLDRTRVIAEARTRQQAIAAGVVGVGLFLMLLLAFAPAPRQMPQAQEEKLSIVGRPDPPAPPALPDPPTRTLDEPVQPAIDLSAAADLCRDLARVTSTQQIPGLLDRAARILDASGIVLWIADPDGRELVPTTTQGYSLSAVARLTSISRNADNATAAAYRSGTVHTVKGDALANGAIVAPLVSPGGCIGVMAAEVRTGREQQEAVRAVAAIVAAQLATLIGVAPAARVTTRREATGGVA
jgi:hypothetical protein